MPMAPEVRIIHQTVDSCGSGDTWPERAGAAAGAAASAAPGSSWARARGRSTRFKSDASSAMVNNTRQRRNDAKQSHLRLLECDWRTTDDPDEMTHPWPC